MLKNTINNAINKLEIKLFLVLFSGYALMGSIPYIEGSASVINQISRFERRTFYAFVLLVSVHYIKCKVFHNNAIYVFMFGLSSWLLLGFFTAFTGSTFVSDEDIYTHVFDNVRYYIMLFLIARFAIIHNLTTKMLTIMLFITGTVLLAAYIINFDGLAFLNPSTLKSLFSSQGRYRYAFGLGHVNGAGRNCLCYIMFFCIHKSLGRSGKLIETYLSFICLPVSIIILLSSASRASITGTILFGLIFFLISTYHKLTPHIKAIFILLLITLFIIIVASVNWDYIYRESGRTLNYTTLSMLDQQGKWLTGLGMIGGKEMIIIIDMPYLDSIYLLGLLETGLLGFILYFGTMFYFAIMYFMNIRSFPNFYKLSGGLIVTMLYYGVFESLLVTTVSFWFGWLLAIVCINERKTLKHSMRPSSSLAINSLLCYK